MLHFSLTVIEALAPLKASKEGTIDSDPLSLQSREVPSVFIGGDLAGIAQTTVEAVNDGKQAAWHMHRYLQVIAILVLKF